MPCNALLWAAINSLLRTELRGGLASLQVSQRVSVGFFVVAVVEQADIALAAKLCNINPASGSPSAADPP